jgi:hypothetical protein
MLCGPPLSPKTISGEDKPVLPARAFLSIQEYTIIAEKVTNVRIDDSQWDSHWELNGPGSQSHPAQVGYTPNTANTFSTVFNAAAMAWMGS